MAAPIHIKARAIDKLPLCGFDSGTKPLAWTTKTSAPALATCWSCVDELFYQKGRALGLNGLSLADWAMIARVQGLPK